MVYYKLVTLLKVKIKTRVQWPVSITWFSKIQRPKDDLYQVSVQSGQWFMRILKGFCYINLYIKLCPP